MLQPSTTRALILIATFTALVLAACSQKAETPPPPAETAAPAPAAAPPPPAPKPENAHAFKIGELSAVALRDGYLEFPNDSKVLGLGHSAEEVNALLTAAGQPTDKLQLGLEPLLVKTTDRVLLFDTGAASSFGPTAGQLPGALAEAGVDPKTRHGHLHLACPRRSRRRPAGCGRRTRVSECDHPHLQAGMEIPHHREGRSRETDRAGES